MSKIYNNVLEIVGNTPLLYVSKLQENVNCNYGKVYTKLEMFNPGGSIKDRTAMEMILSAYDKGLINQDTVIIEPTSGNTGIGLAMVCNYLGLKLIIVMPDNMSIERIKLLKAYQVEVVLTEAKFGMKGSINKANELKEKYSNHFIPGQFTNNDNCNAHYKTTVNEIINDTGGKIDYLVACIGTGGTITGVARKLKEFNEKIKIIGVEPSDSPLITEGKAGAHKIQGIGANFIPDILVLKLIDEIKTVTTEEAYEACRNLVKYEGVLTGISSGAALAVALKLANLKQNEGKVIVCIMPDGGERYLSTDLYSE